MDRSMQRYWKTNKTYMILLLALWALASYGFGIAGPGSRPRVRRSA